jgi:iron complex transport system permease protein
MAGQEAGTQRVLLAGLVLTTGCNAGVALVLNLSPNPMASLELTFWLLGSLSDRSFLHLSWVAAPMVVGLALMLCSGRALRAWSLGPEAARSLGVHSAWLRWRILLGSALAVGAAVSVTGTIGFVGLFVPHLIRPRVRADAAWLLPTSALAGGVLLIWADAAVRASAPLLQGIELKIGVTTALLGTPGLFWYALRARREAWA